jgi:hypothetical protein
VWITIRAAFAAQSIRRWWESMGAKAYPEATKLMITADSGGSNGARVRLWKVELQKLADETGLEISVCHLPPGTSKWNKIEHRLFSFISQNWRAKPLVSHQWNLPHLKIQAQGELDQPRIHGRGADLSERG